MCAQHGGSGGGTLCISRGGSISSPRIYVSERERTLFPLWKKAERIPLFLPLRTHRVSSGDRSSTLGRSSTLLSLSLWLASGSLSLSYFLFYTRGSLAADALFFSLSTNLMTSQFWELADICDVWTNSAGTDRKKKPQSNYGIVHTGLSWGESILNHK